jgi:hypothetical protein
MQVRGTFPELNAGSKKSKSRRNSGTFAKDDRGMTSFSVKRAPKAINAPKTFAGRREASHRKAHGG